MVAFLAMLANPFTSSRTRTSLSRAKAKGVSANTTGEGFIAGGVYVVRTDGQAAYAFLEEDIGDHAPVEDVIDAVRAAAKGEVFTFAPSLMSGDAGADAPAPTPCRSKTWKEWAGRTSGPDGYQIGDITRGLAACLR